ncbi:MAG: tetratricopeptide repeat protein [Firmicutes bacterium]|nr:tetratricopeptide repeat protein [Bacillota bacterium]
MIQVIPFSAGKEPFFLPLLARGLSDLSALRFNAVEIQAQVNTKLNIANWRQYLTDVLPNFRWEGQELWFAGELNARQELTMDLFLYDPQRAQVVYHDFFSGAEEKFLEEWEIHLQNLIGALVSDEQVKSDLKLYTKSLEAFLAFRKGLEILAQAKSARARLEGMESLLKAVAYDPEFFEAADVLLLFLVQNDPAWNFEYSVNMLERLRQIANHHPRIPLALAEIQFQMGNREKAEETLKDLAAKMPQFTDGQIKLALYYYASNRYEEALNVLNTVLSYLPEDPTTLDLMGAIYASKGEEDKAEKLWLLALKGEPGRINVLNNLAILKEEGGNPAQAEDYYREAIELNNAWWGSYFYYGTFCWRHNRFEEAALWLEKAAQLNPTNYQIFQNLGLALIKLGRYSEAQEALLQLLQLAPDNSIRRQTLQLLNQFNDPEIKLEIRIRRLERVWEAGNRWLVFGAMLKLFFQARNRWYYWYLSGKIARDLNLPGLMKIAWNTGLRYEPGFPILKGIGLYYYEKANYRQALPNLKKAYLFYKNDPEIARAYLHTLAQLGEVEELQNNIDDLSKIIDINNSTEINQILSEVIRNGIKNSRVKRRQVPN